MLNGEGHQEMDYSGNVALITEKKTLGSSKRQSKDAKYRHQAKCNEVRKATRSDEACRWIPQNEANRSYGL